MQAFIEENVTVLRSLAALGLALVFTGTAYAASWGYEGKAEVVMVEGQYGLKFAQTDTAKDQ